MVTQEGGAAVSMKYVSQVPIKFLGIGEKIDNIEVFHPDRIANRILGMGDIVSLVEKAAEDLGGRKYKKSRREFKKRTIFYARLLSSIKTNEKKWEALRELCLLCQEYQK